VTNFSALLVEAFAHPFDGLDEEFIALFDDASQIIRKSAVCETDVFVPLEHNDFVFFVQTTKTCGCGRASRDPSYD